MRSVLFMLALATGPSMANGFQVVDVGSAQGSPTRTLVAGVSEPKATVLLFIGGDGMLKLTESGQTGHGHTFVFY